MKSGWRPVAVYARMLGTSAHVPPGAAHLTRCLVHDVRMCCTAFTGNGKLSVGKRCCKPGSCMPGRLTIQGGCLQITWMARLECRMSGAAAHGIRSFKRLGSISECCVHMLNALPTPQNCEWSESPFDHDLQIWTPIGAN